MNRFIGDIHFSHSNILAYDNRPFSTPDENNKTIIDRWNDVVNIDDTTYILGDVSHDNVTRTTEMINQLNGNKILVVGNHDRRFLKNKFFRNAFIEICDYKELDIENGKKLILCHYPIMCYKASYNPNCYMLHGHTHTTREQAFVEKWTKELRDSRNSNSDSCGNIINVGCMMPYMEYSPKTLDEILKRS